MYDTATLHSGKRIQVGDTVKDGTLVYLCKHMAAFENLFYCPYRFRNDYGYRNLQLECRGPKDDVLFEGGGYVCYKIQKKRRRK